MASRNKEAAGKNTIHDGSSSSSTGSEGFSYKGFRPKKKQAPRRQDAGRRYQRGVIYDSELGITCHFCRQKTVEKHVLCRRCVIAFCRRCLKNRHGEDIDIEIADDDNDTWICPKCRGGCGVGCKNCCNCGPCRKKQNLQPPKISFVELSARGFDNVHDFLVHLQTGESPESITARKVGKGWCLSVGTKSASNENSRRQTRVKACKGSGMESNTTKSSPNINAEYNDAKSEVPIRKMKEKSPQFDDVRIDGNTGQGAFYTHSEPPIEAFKIDDAKKTQGIECEGKVREKKYDPFPAGIECEGKVPEKKYDPFPAGIECEGKVTEKKYDPFPAGIECEGKVTEKKYDSFPAGIECEGKVTEKKYDSFPAFLRPREAFKDSLEVRLAEPFNSAELKDLWEKIRCRKPVCRTLETRHGTSSFRTKEAGHSYIDHHPDLAFKLTSTSSQEEKLKLLRGFFFWLEHASTSGAFKPWKWNEKDEECLEIDGPDCEVLGVLLNVDEDQKMSNSTREDQEDVKPKIRRDFVGTSSSSTKFLCNWDQEDIKPKIKEDSIRASSFNPSKRVKEEHDH